MIGVKSSVFRFDGVEVREREFSIIKAGETLPVEPKAFRVLLFLLHNPQKLIRKEELLDAVWGETAVSENSLTRSIALLRRLLGDDTHVPRYIETVATVGYRFICPVEAVEDARGGLTTSDSADTPSEPSPTNNAAEVEAVPAKAQGGSSRTLRRSWLAAAVVAVCILASAIWYLLRPLPKLRVIEYTQIIHDTHHETPIGTDGTRLYFNNYYSPNPLGQSAVTGGVISYYPVSIAGPTISEVSPDGSSMLVLSDEPGLWSVRVSDGSLRHLADDRVSSAAWSPDGALVVYSMPNGDVKVVRSDGTNARKLVTTHDPTGRFFVYGLKWSPDGSKIRFSMSNRIWQISADGSNLHLLLPAWHPSWGQCCGDWTSNGDFFVFLSQDSLFGGATGTPGARMWALDERHRMFAKASAEPVELASGPIRWGMPIPSKDGRKIFARGAVLHGELVRYDAKSRQLQPYLGGISAEFVSFSPDGRYLAYVTFPEGILWRANPDGSNPLQLTDRPWYPKAPRWSPDGSQILFFETPVGGPARGYVIPSDGGTPRPILPERNEPQGDPNWSPDGRKIVYGSQETESGTTTRIIQVLDLDTGRETTLPRSQGLNSPRWSPDGRYVVALFQRPRTDDLLIFDFKTQGWTVLQKEWAGFPTWSHDGKYVYFLRPVGDRGIYRIRPSGGTAERVLDLKGIRQTSVFGFWIGLDPDDTPMLLRDIGSDDIYALTLEEK